MLFAQSVQSPVSLNAQLGFEAPLRIVDAGMNDFTVSA
jgi:hypothetical protein